MKINKMLNDSNRAKFALFAALPPRKPSGGEEESK